MAEVRQSGIYGAGDRSAGSDRRGDPIARHCFCAGVHKLWRPWQPRQRNLLPSGHPQIEAGLPRVVDKPMGIFRVSAPHRKSSHSFLVVTDGDQPAAVKHAPPAARAVIFHNPGGAGVLFRHRWGPGLHCDSLGEHVMRNRKAAGVDADVEARIAQIEQMTLDQIAAFQRRILTEITTGRIAPREASALDRALRKRLKAIEQELRESG